jgi:hypothetical protein
MCACVHTHTSIFVHLHVKGTYQKPKESLCKHENVKQQSRNIDFCGHPPDISVRSMNIVCGIQVLNGQCRIQFRLTIPVQQTDLKLWLVSFHKPVPSPVLCSQQSSSQTSDHFFNALQHFLTYCTLIVPSPYAQLVVNFAGENVFCPKNLNYTVDFFAGPSF